VLENLLYFTQEISLVGSAEMPSLKLSNQVFIFFTDSEAFISAIIFKITHGIDLLKGLEIHQRLEMYTFTSS